MDDVAAVWRASFDPLVNLLPSDAEQRAALEAGELYCAVDDATGQVVGAVQFRFTKSTGFIWHLAVLPAHRNRHIGRALTRHYFYLAQLRKIANHQLWWWRAMPARFGFTSATAMRLTALIRSSICCKI